MATERQLDALAAYEAMMREISQRLWWLEYMLEGRTGMPSLLLRDSGFLQVRMICELLAYSCLIVHGDIEEAQAPKLQNAWHADEIMKALEKIHPDFFPHAHHKVAVAPGRWHFDCGDEKALDRQSFAELYGRCGGELHRGSLLKIIGERGSKNLSLDDLASAHERLVLTIPCHSIALLDRGTRFVCDFIPSLEGNVTAVLGVAE